MAINRVGSAEIIDGLYTYLTGVSTFNTSIGGRVYYGLAPRDATMPFAVVTLIDFVPLDTMPKDGYEARAQVSMYASKAASTARAIGAIADNLRDRMHRASFAVTGHTQMISDADITRGPTLEDDAWRVDTDFLIRGFAS